jgi:aminotransferase class I and II
MNGSSLPALPAVYSFLFPEVADVIRRFDAAFDPDLLRVGTPAASLTAWIREHVSGSLVAPSMPDGRVDLDALHEPLIERVVELHAKLAPGLADLAWRYPTSGSSEGIVHLLARLRTTGARGIRVIDGEYEGFGITAGHLALGVESYPMDALPDVAPDPAVVWWISQPSARDGNLLPTSVLDGLLARGHRVILDLAYLGSTDTLAPLVDLRHPGIEAVVMSLSKPYGLFRWRVGWTFAREAVPSLFGNRWFNDIARQLLGLAVLEAVGPTRLAPAWRPTQTGIVASLDAAHGLRLRPSDSVLLASMAVTDAAGLSAQARALLAPFRRADAYRLCLTPALELARTSALRGDDPVAA